MSTNTPTFTNSEPAPGVQSAAQEVALKEVIKEPFTPVSAKDAAKAPTLAAKGGRFVSQR
jgi:hypothetical protein